MVLLQVKTILFDVAGTLYSSHSIDDAYLQEMCSDLAERFGVDIGKASEMFERRRAELKNAGRTATKTAIMESFGLSRDRVFEAICRVSPQRYLQQDRELVHTLDILAENFEIGLISNSPRQHVDDVLAALGAASNMFSIIVSVEMFRENKPSLEPFKVALKKTASKPSECLYVGDSISKDIEPAHELGMKTVLVSGASELSADGPADAVIKDVHRLPEILKSP